jgi:hypothetical protein
MNRRLRRYAWCLTAAAWAGMLAGCVERRFVINTDQEGAGAVVFENGKPLGAAPADNHFVYYGKYRFTLVKDGYDTLVVDQNIPPPWYEYPGLDFISENLIPFTIRDRREFCYHLEPMRVPSAGELLSHATGLRSRGQALGPSPGTPVALPDGTVAAP